MSGLSVDPADLDFGEVWEDPGFVRTITVRNRGPQPVAVSDLQGGCECTEVSPRAFTLPPGGEQSVAVKIDLTHRYPYHFGVERREIAVGVRPVLSGRGLAVDAWTVRGVVKSRVSADGRELAFADLCGQGVPPVTRAMKVTAHVPLQALEAHAPPELATVQVVTAKRPGGYDVRVTPNPNMPLGAFKFDVPLTAVLPDGTKHRCVAFRVTGEMRSAARAVPEQVLLGELPVGATAEATVCLDLPASGWMVDRIETERPDTVVTRGPPLDGRPTYLISQPVTALGDQSAQLRFVCRKPNGQLETVTATLRWYGEPAPAVKEDRP